MISQNAKIHRNTFQSGVNKDFNKTLVPSESMVDAANVSLIDNGVFFSVQNIKGTVNVQSIIGTANTEVLAVFPTKYKINTTYDIDCLTIFTATASANFKIWCYDTVNDTLYELFQEATPVDYLTDDRVIDAKILSENGVTILYFVDNYNEPRKLRCEIPAVYTANFLNSFDLSLIRKGAIGQVTSYTVMDGGSLFTGTYQFAYQMLTPDKNKFTKWSLLTNPIPVFTTDEHAGYGLSSSRKLRLTITPSEDELNNYTHFRLAILENIYPEGTDNTACSLTETMAVADYISGSTLASVDYKANLQNNQVDLSEIVIDHSAIETAKTLEIRDNRLVLGNITYKNLEYDNGTPEIATGSIISQNLLPEFEGSVGLYVGHFRDEVYRFAISYFDENGNFSSPIPLDMTNVVSNQSGQTGFKDMKFPKRSQVLSLSRFSVLNGINPVSLGLQLNGIDNHPTWARGFVILRRERIKNIQWQSPLIPMTKIYGIGACQHYPTQGLEQDPREIVTYPDATPMGPSTTFVPMNLFLPKQREIVNNKTKSGSGVNRKVEGEAYMTSSDKQSMSLVFPPQTMYTQNSKYTFNQSHQLETVDACKLQELRTKHSGEAVYLGARIDSSYSATFYALKDSMYYYDDAHSGAKAALRSSMFTINGYKDFDNYSEGSSINGNDAMIYNNLVTGGIGWEGVKPPSVQRCGIVDLNEFTPINNSSSLTFAAGGTTVEAYDSSAYYTAAGKGTSSSEGSVYVNTIEIVNCVAGLADDRYGSIDAPADYVYTGTKVVFTNAELPTVQAGSTLPKTVSVWGGDCIVSSHTYKITDTSYNIPNQSKFAAGAGQTHEQVIDKWGRAFYDKASGTSADLCLPVAIKNSSTYIQIYIESEYNGDVMDYNNLDIATGSTYLSSSLYGVNYNSKESSCRVPLNYNYNVNLSKQNNDKIFRSRDLSVPAITNLGARLLYSDIKLYQTQTEGFDIFRVLNFYDLLETYGPITKLQGVGDNLYALQESGVSWIGVGERVIEATDSSQLAVRSGDFIGSVILISTIRGCQHLRSVVSDGTSMYFADNINKTINQVSGRDLQIISDIGMATEFRSKFGSLIPENELVGVYDPIKKEYLIGRSGGEFCWVFNTALNVWVSNYTFAANNFLGGAYTNQKLYLIGRGVDNNNISVHEMYTGANSYLMGTYVVPYIKIVVNPDLEMSKTFDDVLINASDRLDTFDILVEREAALGNQTISGIDLDVSSRGEGNFRVKTLRDASNRRPRGTYGIYTFNWNSSVSAPQVNLTSVITKYRLSENVF